jgi:hypothetical protein
MRKPRLFLSLIVLLIGLSFVWQGCIPEVQYTEDRGLKWPKRTERKVESSTGTYLQINEYHPIIKLYGPGSFISAQAWKQGGTTDKSFVKLYIDGETVVEFSFQRGELLGFRQGNPFGITSFPAAGHPDDVDVMTMAFSTPLFYKDSLEISVFVRDTGITKIVAEVIYASENKYGDRPPGEKTDPGGEIPD